MKHPKHRRRAGVALLVTASAFLTGAALESALRTQHIRQLDEARKQVEAQLHQNSEKGDRDAQ